MMGPMKKLALALCLFPLSGFAQFKLEALNEKDPSVLTFIQDVEDTLPSSMKEGINKRVTVRFKELKYGNKVVQGQLIRNPLFPKKSTHIDLHNRLLTSIRNKKNYKLAKATLLHEISHVYDLQNLQVGHEKELNIKNKDHTISDSPVFLSVSGWQKKKITRKYYQMNTVESRRVDLYEDKSPEETFAVNMEHFLLDPQYKCRKPSMHAYLSKALNHVPFESKVCQQETRLVPVINMDASVQKQRVLDPEKLYEVHYFFAGQGKNMMSRWGHAMLRLVMCAPNRTAVDEKCLQDRAHHLVLSFRADITNFNIDYIKGLTGKYPSKMFVLSMADVIKEYTAGELRDLYSIPLKMNEEQKKLLISQVLERYWGYQSKYYFVTNNCADETLNLLKNVYLDDMDIVDMKVLTPLAIKTKFEEQGLADMSVFDNKELAKKKGYFFESLNPKLQRIFSDLIQSGVLTKNDHDHAKFLDESTLNDRKEIASRAKNSEDLGKLIFIEETIINRKALGIQKDIGKVLNDQDSSEQGGKLIELFRQMEKFKEKRSGLDLTHGYGIPQKSDEIFKTPDFTDEDEKKLKELQKMFLDEALLSFNKDYEEITKLMIHKNELFKKMLGK